MARFYADIKGNRGEASRMGTAVSGMRGHIRGWKIGASVCVSANDDGSDCVRVTLTSGSTGHKESILLGEFNTNGQGKVGTDIAKRFKAWFAKED